MADVLLQIFDRPDMSRIKAFKKKKNFKANATHA
jgi:hypothetical protein